MSSQVPRGASSCLFSTWLQTASPALPRPRIHLRLFPPRRFPLSLRLCPRFSCRRTAPWLRLPRLRRITFTPCCWCCWFFVWCLVMCWFVWLCPERKPCRPPPITSLCLWPCPTCSWPRWWCPGASIWRSVDIVIGRLNW